MTDDNIIRRILRTIYIFPIKRKKVQIIIKTPVDIHRTSLQIQIILMKALILISELKEAHRLFLRKKDSPLTFPMKTV